MDDRTIKGLRVQAGLTQVQLAASAGVSPSTVYKWESAISEPTARNLRDVAVALGVNMGDIDLTPWDEKEHRQKRNASGGV